MKPEEIRELGDICAVTTTFFSYLHLQGWRERKGKQLTLKVIKLMKFGFLKSRFIN